MDAPGPPPTTIRRRRVFFLHGLDPRGPNHYHALYREQAALQGRVTGRVLTVGAAQWVERLVTRWTVDDPDGTRSEFDALRWDDLIRQRWRRGGLRLLWDHLRAYRVIVACGAGRRIARLSRAYWFTMTYPLVSALLVLAIPLAVAWLAWSTSTGAGPWAAAALALIAGGLALAILRRCATWIKADWIMQITAFTVDQGADRVAGLEPRITQFAERVRTALADPALDEVLVVGHSAGAALAVAVVARATAGSAAVPADRDPRLGLLTIGHMIPTIGLNPQAERFRAELAAVAALGHLTWIDVSAPPDGACFALTDPVTACGLAATGRPRLVPARFHKQFTPQRYRQVLRSRFRIHFQYLMAAELPAGFDYFLATAGPRPLAALETP